MGALLEDGKGAWITYPSLPIIRESVDSLRRDGANAQYMQYLSKSRITSPQTSYLSAQGSSLSAFVISKTHIVAQMPRGRQLNAKVCGSKSAIFRILLSSSFFIARNATTRTSHSLETSVTFPLHVLHVLLREPAVNDRTLASVCYTVFIPALTQP